MNYIDLKLAHFATTLKWEQTLSGKHKQLIETLQLTYPDIKLQELGTIANNTIKSNRLQGYLSRADNLNLQLVNINGTFGMLKSYKLDFNKGFSFKTAKDYLDELNYCLSTPSKGVRISTVERILHYVFITFHGMNYDRAVVVAEIALLESSIQKLFESSGGSEVFYYLLNQWEED